MAIKMYRSNQPGAPVLSGTQGSLIAVLDACLVNGFGQVAVATLARVGNIVTCTTADPHKFESFDRVEIAGADQADYDSDFSITRIDAYSFSFEVTGAPDTPGTGSIIAKRAPAGFSKAFAAINKAVYRSNSLTGNRHYFRVVDDGTTLLGGRTSRVRGYETMVSVDGGQLPFPLLTQIGGDGLHWYKSDAANATGRAWIIVSDGKTVYMMISNNRGPTDFADDGSSQLNAFGEYSTFVPDAYASFLSGLENENDPNYSNAGILRCSGDMAPNAYSRGSPIAIARLFNGNQGAIYGISHLGHGFANQYTIGQNAQIPFPNLPDNRYYMAPVLQYDPGSYIRSQLPGAYESLHGRTHTQGMLMENANVVGLENRRFMFLGGRSYNASYFGGIFVDLTGPWEVR